MNINHLCLIKWLMKFFSKWLMYCNMIQHDVSLTPDGGPDGLVRCGIAVPGGGFPRQCWSQVREASGQQWDACCLHIRCKWSNIKNGWFRWFNEAPIISNNYTESSVIKYLQRKNMTSTLNTKSTVTCRFSSIFHWKVHVRSPSCGGPTANHARPHLWQMQLDPIISYYIYICIYNAL